MDHRPRAAGAGCRHRDWPVPYRQWALHRPCTYKGCCGAAPTDARPEAVANGTQTGGFGIDPGGARLLPPSLAPFGLRSGPGFCRCLREATEHPAALTSEQRDLGARAAKAESLVKADQDQVARLTRQLATAGESDKENLQGQLDVVGAQLELDQDELDDAKQDLERAGGNTQGKIQRLLQEHEAGHNDAAPGPSHEGQDAEYQSSNLAPQIRAWLALETKRSLLDRARQDALDSMPILTRAHDAFRAAHQSPGRSEAGGERQGVRTCQRAGSSG
jgi:hypothetical protein